MIIPLFSFSHPLMIKDSASVEIDISISQGKAFFDKEENTFTIPVSMNETTGTLSTPNEDWKDPIISFNISVFPNTDMLWKPDTQFPITFTTTCQDSDSYYPILSKVKGSSDWKIQYSDTTTSSYHTYTTFIHYGSRKTVTAEITLSTIACYELLNSPLDSFYITVYDQTYFFKVIPILYET